jgi:hypothetical protein
MTVGSYIFIRKKSWGNINSMHKSLLQMPNTKNEVYVSDLSVGFRQVLLASKWTHKSSSR